MRARRFLPALLAVAALAGVARADISEEQRRRAAQAFDAGVKHFQNAEYEQAAKAFLLADELLANSQALSNAIAAARKANDDLLVAKTAERAIDRSAADPSLAASAREALAEAEKRLVRLDVGCEPAPCTVRLDNEAVQPGKRYVLPGTHVASADGENGAQATERLNFVAGGVYRVVLHPVGASAAPKPASVDREGGPAGSSSSSPGAPPRTGETKAKPLPAAVVYVGGGLTLALAGVMAWSGFDTLSAKNALPSPPTTPERDDVRSKIRRTDILLGATAVVGIATVAVAFTLVDWGGGKASASISPTPGGGRFGVGSTF